MKLLKYLIFTTVINILVVSCYSPYQSIDKIEMYQKKLMENILNKPDSLFAILSDTNNIHPVCIKNLKDATEIWNNQFIIKFIRQNFKCNHRIISNYKNDSETPIHNNNYNTYKLIHSMYQVVTIVDLCSRKRIYFSFTKEDNSNKYLLVRVDDADPFGSRFTEPIK